jgi:hypothetical protein
MQTTASQKNIPIHQRGQCGRSASIVGLLLAWLGLMPLPGQAEDYTYSTNNNAITITGYAGVGGDVTIPDTINSLPVTAIDLNAFNGRSSLTNVTLPDSIVSIGQEAFEYCGNLTNVTLGAGVTNIGYHAFNSCSQLVTFTVAADNPAFSSLDGVLFDRNQATLIQYPAFKFGSYLIPDSVTRIGNGAFLSCPELTGITIPDHVLDIEDGAFQSCSGLGSVTLPDSVTNIGNVAFCYCTGLTNATVGGGAAGLEQTFSQCSRLQSVTLGNGPVLHHPRHRHQSGRRFRRLHQPDQHHHSRQRHPHWRRHLRRLSKSGHGHFEHQPHQH